jgi:hypothetical protein
MVISNMRKEMKANLSNLKYDITIGGSSEYIIPLEINTQEA